MYCTHTIIRYSPLKFQAKTHFLCHFYVVTLRIKLLTIWHNPTTLLAQAIFESNKPIRDFPVPRNITDLRSFLGLANQFGDYLPDLRHTMEPLKPLLTKEKCLCLVPTPHKCNGKGQEYNHWTSMSQAL